MTRWPWMLKFGLPAALLSLLLSACAGGFRTGESQTSINSEPTAARCTLEGVNFSTTVQTPAQIVLPKEAAPIKLTCGAARHRAFVTTLAPRFNEKVFGNLLLGSVAGLIVDFSNGHDAKYPERVNVNLEPNAFATIDARDAWFGRYRTYIDWKWGQAEAEVIDVCKADGEDYDCLERRKVVEAGRAQEMDTLERRRRQAHIDARSTAETPSDIALPQ